jgi:hypothetical protein
MIVEFKIEAMKRELMGDTYKLADFTFFISTHRILELHAYVISKIKMYIYLLALLMKKCFT